MAQAPPACVPGGISDKNKTPVPPYKTARYPILPGVFCDRTLAALFIRQMQPDRRHGRFERLQGRAVHDDHAGGVVVFA
jgi:hypothetical protein